MMFFFPFGHFFSSDMIVINKAGWWLHMLQLKSSILAFQTSHWGTVMRWVCCSQMRTHADHWWSTVWNMQNWLVSVHFQSFHTLLWSIRSGGVSSGERHLFSISFWHFLTTVFSSFSSAFQSHRGPCSYCVISFSFLSTAPPPPLAGGNMWQWCCWCCHAIQLSNDASSFKRLTACENFISMRNVCFLLDFVLDNKQQTSCL